MLGEHKLSSSALDAALDSAKTGELLYSESMTCRARALVGKAAGSPHEDDSSHWSEETGKQRLLEVMGRMDGDRALLEKLLLHGLS